VGNEVKQIQPRMGRKKLSTGNFLSPHLGLGWLDDQTHGFTVGYYLSRLRRWVP